jgi:hypothetical protein
MAAAAAGAVPAAQAAPGPQVRTFRVEAHGVQRTTWTESHQPAFACDEGSTGSGSETMRFRSGKPGTVVAYRYGRNAVIFGSTGTELIVRATVTRHGHVSVTPASPTCGGTGGGGTPPVPDCGTRRTRLDLRLDWRPSGPTGITLDTGTIVPPYALFLNCPVLGDAFPHVLNAVGGAPIVARMPASDLFDPTLRKHIVLGHGRVRRPSSDSASITSIRWIVSLTAVR